MPLLFLEQSPNKKNTETNIINHSAKKLFRNHFVLIFSTLLSGTVFSFAQRSELKYNVIQNKDIIGWLKLNKSDSANSSVIKFSSEIKKRLIILFTIIEQQESLFQNGILTYSHVYRKVNDNVKINKQTTHTGDHYLVKKEKTATPLMINNIGYNQLSLYFYEPGDIKEVYSDNYERYLKLEKAGGQYILKLPDGNKTTYYYSNGICTKVKVEQSLFTVEFVLVK